MYIVDVWVDESMMHGFIYDLWMDVGMYACICICIHCVWETRPSQCK